VRSGLVYYGKIVPRFRSEIEFPELSWPAGVLVFPEKEEVVVGFESELGYVEGAVDRYD